ncbi:MAG TPA: ATP-binding protein [Gemmatimonadaceae bacterium]|jgi:PAS domain S-box-containing protein
MLPEVRRLRVALRDLVALSTLPAAWAGREPQTIATGLADVLIGALQLDFVFVRLNDHGGHAPVDASRGDAWKTFPSWLESRLASDRRKLFKQVIPDIGGGAKPRRGLIAPIGFDGLGGVAAVASDRNDFPTETDQLLLSVATNHAALAFQSAQLVHDLRTTEDRLRQARDELETKVAERTGELRRAGAELQTILDASPVAMVLVRRDRTVQRCNSAFERLVGLGANEVVGQRIPLTETIEERWAPLGDGHAFSGIEIRMTRKDGSEFDATLACAPLVDDEGRSAGVVANILDISDRKRAEEALRKAELELAHVTRLTMLGEMAASIAHEINQPLTAIVANATASLNWLSRPDAKLERAREALADIVKDGHRAADVIQRVRQLATKSDPKKTYLNINDVVRDVTTLVRSEIQKHRVSLCMSLASPLPSVFADRVQLQQVIINLVMNAVEAMDPVDDRRRELRIQSEVCEDRIVVAVQDDGVGIAPRQMDRLFSAFYTTKSGGMGIGLSISRSIIEGHGGRLWATPNAEHGSTFEFTLPVAS